LFRVAVFPVHSWLSTETGNVERGTEPFNRQRARSRCQT
jgi:hypothetical protein